MKIKRVRRYHFVWLLGLSIFLFSSGCQRAIPGIAEGFTYNDLYTLDNGKDLSSAAIALNRDGSINAVVEIPAGLPSITILAALRKEWFLEKIIPIPNV
jgi:hypothetical protein